MAIAIGRTTALGICFSEVNVSAQDFSVNGIFSCGAYDASILHIETGIIGRDAPVSHGILKPIFSDWSGMG